MIFIVQSVRRVIRAHPARVGFILGRVLVEFEPDYRLHGGISPMMATFCRQNNRLVTSMTSLWSESDPCWIQNKNLATGSDQQNLPEQTISSSAAKEKLSAEQILWRLPIGIHDFSFGNIKYQEIIRKPSYKSIKISLDSDLQRENNIYYYMAESVFDMRLVNLRSVTCYTDQNF